MPAATDVRYYTWWMSEDHTARVVAYEWWPLDGQGCYPTSLGTLTFKFRDTPGDVWGPGMNVGEMNLATARALVRGQGFGFETGETD